MNVQPSNEIFKNGSLNMFNFPKALLNIDQGLYDMPVTPLFPHCNLAKNPSSHPGLIQKFSQMVAQHPEKIAIESIERVLSYQELQRLSDVTAAYFETHLKPHDRLAIIGARTDKLVIILVAAFKAGITISLLDPKHPEAYLNQCLEIIGADALINLSHLSIRPDSRLNLKLFIENFNEENIQPVQSRKSYLQDVFTSNDTGIITFTSGTSGVPKAVAGRYGSLTHFFPWMDKTFGPFANDRFGLCSNIAHDPLQRDIFTPLYLGATIVIPSDDDIFMIGHLPKWLSKSKISICCFTPAMCKFVTTEANVLPDLRLIFFVGASLSKQQVLQLKTVTDAQVINLYGSTETQRAVSYFAVPKTIEEISLLPDIIPIGRGMRDVDLMILDENKAPIEIAHEMGEIAVRSRFISKGYLNAENDRFIINPATNDPLDRLYVTGDYGYYDPQYGVRCVGRKDSQIKLRGYRIELDQINNAALTSDLVKEAASILIKPNNVEEGLIVTFLSPKSILVQFDGRRFREFLAESLPPYMVPTEIIHIPDIPLTQNGKVDTRQLEEYYWVSHDQGSVEIPSTSLQENGSVFDLLQKLKTFINVKDIDPATPLAHYGLDSLKLFSFLAEIKTQFPQYYTQYIHINMSLNDILQANSILIERQPEKIECDLIHTFGPIQEINETTITFAHHTMEHFCSNSYLGLNQESELREKLQAFLKSSSSFGVHGSTELNAFTTHHEQLTQKIQSIYHCDAVLFYNSAYMANISAIASLASSSDSVFIDADCHKSIFDGCQLAGASIYVFSHNDAQSLEDKIKTSKNVQGKKIVIVEGVYSVKGDYLNLPDISAITRKYGGLLYIDEACSLGMIGAHGFGIEEHFSMPGAADIRVGTFSKALQSNGGYVACSHTVSQMLRYKHAQAFSGGLSSLSCVIATEALTLLMEQDQLFNQLNINALHWREGLIKLGLPIRSKTAIVALDFKSHGEAKHVYDGLIQRNIYTLPLFSPWSAEGLSIRTSVTAKHSFAQIENALNQLRVLL